MDKAQQARENAYAPYSHFKVGAAVLLDSGVIVSGNNQENAVFPSGLCAERVAVFHAGAAYPNLPIRAIAISACALNHRLSSPAAPCGACRQALLEYEVKQATPIAIYFMGEKGKVIKAGSVKGLLPVPFNNTFL